MKRFSIYLIVVYVAFTHVLANAQESAPAGVADNKLVVTAARIYKDEDSFYELQASAVVRAAPQQVWKKLTAYNEMSTYVPNLVSARLVSHSGHESTIEQKWVKRVLFFHLTANLVVRAIERPLTRIDISLISGEMKKYSATWEMVPIGPDGVNGTRISYHGMVEPESYIPAFFGTAMMRSDLKRMMEAVLVEIDK